MSAVVVFGVEWGKCLGGADVRAHVNTSVGSIADIEHPTRKQIWLRMPQI